MESIQNKEFITIPELAHLLGISRIAVFKKVKSGEIEAKKVGRIYLIPMAKINNFLSSDITVQRKSEIEAAVKKTFAEYGEVLKRLGAE